MILHGTIHYTIFYKYCIPIRFWHHRLDHWFPTFSGLRHPTEKKYNMRHPMANPYQFALILPVLANIYIYVRRKLAKVTRRSIYMFSWAQFCCKMWGDSLVWNQWSHWVDAEVTFYKYRFPVLFIEMFFESKTNHANTSIGFYQSCQLDCTKCWIALVTHTYQSYSRTHQFSFIL